VSDDEMYYLTDGEGEILPEEVYDNEDDAVDARARLVASHPDEDDVTVETEESIIDQLRQEIMDAEKMLDELQEQDLSPEQEKLIEQFEYRVKNQKQKQELLEEVKNRQ